MYLILYLASLSSFFFFLSYFIIGFLRFSRTTVISSADRDHFLFHFSRLLLVPPDSRQQLPPTVLRSQPSSSLKGWIVNIFSAAGRTLQLLGSAVAVQELPRTISNSQAWLCSRKILFTKSSGQPNLGPKFAHTGMGDHGCLPCCLILLETEYFPTK